MRIPFNIVHHAAIGINCTANLPFLSASGNVFDHEMALNVCAADNHNNKTNLYTNTAVRELDRRFKRNTHFSCQFRLTHEKQLCSEPVREKEGRPHRAAIYWSQKIGKHNFIFSAEIAMWCVHL